MLPWTQNKAIQKIRESYRVSDADKELVKSFKKFVYNRLRFFETIEVERFSRLAELRLSAWKVALAEAGCVVVVSTSSVMIVSSVAAIASSAE